MKSLTELFFSKKEIQDSFNYFYERNYEYLFEDKRQNPSFKQFVLNWNQYSKILFEAVRNAEYVPSPAVPIHIFVGKPRTAYRLDYPDQFLMTHFSRLASQLIEPQLSDSLFSFRKGRSQQRALERLSAYISSCEGPIFINRVDVRDFGNTMKKEVIIRDLKEFVTQEDRFVSMISNWCEFPVLGENGVLSKTPALPTGAHLQLVFENLYLTHLDKQLDRIADSIYLRFGDDILFASKDQCTSENAFKVILSEMTSRQIEPHPKKTKSFVLVKPHQIDKTLQSCCVFEYLGMNIDFEGRVLLPPRKMKEVQKFFRIRLNTMLNALPGERDAAEKVGLMIKTLRENLLRSELLDHNPIVDLLRSARDERQLKEFDRWLSILITKLALNQGFKPSNHRMISMDVLRDWGLPSLLHLSRTHAL